MIIYPAPYQIDSWVTSTNKPIPRVTWKSNVGGPPTIYVSYVCKVAFHILILEHPEIFVRIENGYKIKDVLFRGIEALKKEVSEVQSIFKKLM